MMVKTDVKRIEGKKGYMKNFYLIIKNTKLSSSVSRLCIFHHLATLFYPFNILLLATRAARAKSTPLNRKSSAPSVCEFHPHVL